MSGYFRPVFKTAEQRPYSTLLYRTARAQLVREYEGAICPDCKTVVMSDKLPNAAPGKLTVDHIVPLARGGTHDPVNLRAVCHACNSRKSDRTPEQVAALAPWREGDDLARFDVAPFGSGNW